MPLQFDPPSGTRDFLAAELETRQRAFAVIDRVYTSYGFEPLQTPAFERLDVLMGKYGDEGDKLIFKILRRGAPRPTAAGSRRRTSATRSARCGGPTGRARAATASSPSATSTPWGRPRCWPTPRWCAPRTRR